VTKQTEQQEQALKRVMVPMSDALIAEIGDFRFEERRDSQADAVRELVRLGLEVWRGKSSAFVEKPETVTEAVAAGLVKTSPHSEQRKARKGSAK
jgi:hypothetical protein